MFCLKGYCYQNDLHLSGLTVTSADINQLQVIDNNTESEETLLRYSGINYVIQGFLLNNFFADKPSWIKYVLTIIAVAVTAAGFIIVVSFKRKLRNERFFHTFKLKESEKQLRNITENMPGMVFQFYYDQKGNSEFSFVDGKVVELLGIGGDVGRFYEKFIIHIHEADKDIFIESIKLAATSNIPWFFEGRFIKSDGEIIWLRGTASTEKLEEKVEFNGIFLDVTKEKRLESRIKQSQKMDAIGQLAGGVAHDFNNVLAAIMGSTEMLKMRIGSDSENTALLNMILDAGSRASSLTKKLLTFSRQGIELKRVVDLHSLVDDSMALLSGGIDKRVSIVTELNAENSQVECDPSLIQNAILNLGINACDSMLEGGALTITSKNVELDENYCERSNFPIKPGPHLQLRVEDTGSGMSKSVLEKIFDPFYTTKEEGKGTGLGLPAVYNAMVEHEGALKVISELGKGSVFTLYLPVSRKVESRALAKKGDRITGEGTLLLIEDEELLRTTGKLLLEDIGYEVITAEDGSEGVEVYRRNRDKIDLVILDMVMPKMNGRDCFLAIHAINPEVKVLIASGFTREDSLRDLFDMGLAGFIWKPFQQSIMSSKIAEVLTGGDCKQEPQAITNDEVSLRSIAKPDIESEAAGVLELTALVAIQDNVFREIIADLLKERGYRIDAPGDYESSMSLVSDKYYSLILADWDYVGKNGLDICIYGKKRSKKGEYCYTMMMPDKRYASELKKFLGNGIDDYIVKPFTLDYFAVRIGVAEKHLVNIVKRSEAEAALRDVNEYLESQIAQRTKDLELTNKQLEQEISERKNAEYEKDQKQAQIVHSGRLAALGEMATAIAHEINQPLNIIQISADAISQEIEEDIVDREELKAIHGDIQKQIERASGIIRNVRSFARQETLPVLEICEIDECVIGALDFFHEQFRLREIELVTEFDSKLPGAIIDPKKFQQVVVNLLLNSQYAIYEKEMAEGSFDKRIIIRLNHDSESNQIIFEVEDNGCGMNEDVKKKCLDPFFTTKPVDEGTGLGTSITYGIVKEFCGSIEIDSVVGEGTIFRIFVPSETNTAIKEQQDE